MPVKITKGLWLFDMIQDSQRLRESLLRMRQGFCEITPI